MTSRLLVPGLFVLLGAAGPSSAPERAPAPEISPRKRDTVQRRQVVQSPRPAAPSARPSPRRPAPGLQRCEVLIPQLDARLPFGPGEELGFVISLSGVYVGRASLTLGERSSHGSHVVYPAYGQASTNSFFTKMSKMESQQTSLVTPDGVFPLLMQSHARAETLTRQEEVRFDPGQHRAMASLRMEGTSSSQQRRDWKGEAQGGQAVQDVVSIVYFARSRQVQPGASYCTEIYYGKRLWVVRGQVGEAESVSTPAGPYRAMPVRGEAVREGEPRYARQFTVWLTDDEDRLPVRLVSPTAYGEIEVRIDQFRRGRRLVREAQVAQQQPLRQ
ncbi:MAG: DUF3108 domain-containing protein [Pseudomonadota bacterium]